MVLGKEPKLRSVVGLRSSKTPFWKCKYCGVKHDKFIIFNFKSKSNLMSSHLSLLDSFILDHQSTVGWSPAAYPPGKSQAQKELTGAEFPAPTPKKWRSSRIEPRTTEPRQPKLSLNSLPSVPLDYGLNKTPDKALNGFEGRTVYVLGSMNSIAVCTATSKQTTT